jgi:predicted dienelactone hydrolase
VLATVLVLASGLVVFKYYSSAPASVSTTTTSATTSSRSTTTMLPIHATYAVGLVILRIEEPATTQLAARSLVTTVRYPALGAPGGSAVTGATPARGANPYPLVVFSQGFGIDPQSYARLLNAWAGAGYVVAAPRYPFTSPGSPGGLVETDIVHHPADLSFVITSLLKDSARSGGALSGLVSRSEIAVIGHSDGGDVSLATAANTCCRDRRVKVAVILSGAELKWFKGTYFATPAMPLLVVQGTVDPSLNPVACSVQIYDQAPQPKYYLSMLGQTHFSAYLPAGPALNVVKRVTLDFLNAYLRNSPSSLAAITRAGRVAGLATITRQHSVAPFAGSCPGAPTG